MGNQAPKQPAADDKPVRKHHQHQEACDQKARHSPPGFSGVHRAAARVKQQRRQGEKQHRCDQHRWHRSSSASDVPGQGLPPRAAAQRGINEQSEPKHRIDDAQSHHQPRRTEAVGWHGEGGDFYHLEHPLDLWCAV